MSYIVLDTLNQQLGTHRRRSEPVRSSQGTTPDVLRPQADRLPRLARPKPSAA
jgi:hypothetical protein